MATGAVACATCELHAEAVFRVEGMDCNEEVVILERRLKPLAGLEAISADLIGQRLHVKYDAAKLTTAAMVDAVGQTGMRMWLEHEAPADTSADVTRRRWLLMACGAAIAGGVAASAAGLATAAVVLFVAATLAGVVSPAQRAFAAVRTRTIDINVLMVVAVAGALALGEWLEGASVVFLFAVAQWLEVRTLERARQAIRALVDLSPREATVRRGRQLARLAVESIDVGDVVVVRPGDKVPLDGVVTAGRSDVNEAPLTGESLPIDKADGDEIYAGTINGRGALDVKVTRLVRDTRLAKIIHLVETAQASRAPVQSFVDRFARWYTPAVILVAVALALVPAALGAADTGEWLYRALVLLVIACPCALVISTPVSVVSALSAAARNGVLIKGGVFLERLAGIRVVAFDKTGTLTQGELLVDDVVTFGPLSAAEVLELAAAVETHSEHTIGRAITRKAGDIGMTASGFVSTPGLGATADVAGRQVVVGNVRLMQQHGITVPAGQRALVFVAVDGELAGAIALVDRVRDAARDAVDLLREQGITHVAMLTGDHPDTAGVVARQAGILEHHAALTPPEKHARIAALRAAHGPVMMVGDGVNDAPALATADVGVAMGAAASDAALETADVALMSGELLKLPYALRLAQATLRNIKTNVAISLALKAAFLVLAVTGSATLWMAVLADTGASVIVVGNALRLLRER